MKKTVQVACIGIAMALLAGIFAEKVHHDTLFGWHSMACVCAEEEKHSQQSGLDVNAKSAYVMEIQSETPIYSKEENKRLPIASMCKIMTLLLAFEAIDEGVISMDEEVCISENAAAMGGSQVFLEANKQYKVNELIKSIVVASANDACVAMAERICGSESAFVYKMNEKCTELGLNDTRFSNCTG